jgi:thioredoxin 1
MLLFNGRPCVAMSNVATVTNDDFASFSTQAGVVLVDFWAPWCGPCKRVGPIIDQLSTEMDGVNFGKLNTDENQETAVASGVMSIPTMMVFKNGEKVDQIVGALPKEQIKATLEKHL